MCGYACLTIKTEQIHITNTFINDNRNPRPDTINHDDDKNERSTSINKHRRNNHSNHNDEQEQNVDNHNQAQANQSLILLEQFGKTGINENCILIETGIGGQHGNSTVA